jgi:hypothetical protein
LHFMIQAVDTFQEFFNKNLKKSLADRPQLKKSFFISIKLNKNWASNQIFSKEKNNRKI